ncbi:MAG: beta-galactosidase [Fimbriimonadaceae bacterium]
MTTLSDRPPLNLSTLLHGADYYPEQWSAEVWAEDLELMGEVRLNAVTLGVFAWSELEPAEGQYKFDWLDEIIGRLHSLGKRISLATPSAAPPAWMTKAYPEILRTGPDRVRRLPGNRANFCWSSTVYRKKTAAINEQLAKRYGHHPALLLWHVSNEYGGECYCELCTAAFRSWLRDKYKEDLTALNSAYWARFWSHRFTEWTEIEIPGPPLGETSNQGLSLDYKRFNTSQIVDFFEAEAKPLRAISPQIPVTTNLMGFYQGVDPWKLSIHLDVAGWDSYPQFRSTPIDARGWAKAAMTHDLVRTIGGGKPWLLMECSPSSSNWYPVMNLKPPGMHLFETLQAVAHGSDSVMYFQWRQSRGGQEKFHGAVVSTGQHGTSKVFGDVAQVGAALESLRDVVGSTTIAEAAVIFDWENGWAIDGACGPIQADRRYFDTVLDHYVPFWEAGISIDVISQECDFAQYKLLVAPMLYLLKPGVAARMKAFVEAGGTLLATYMSGWSDENDLTFENGIFSPLSDLFGIRVEELDALYPEQQPCVVLPRGTHFGVEGAFVVNGFAERIHVIDAEVVGSYGKFWYGEEPAITRRFHGRGEAIYVGARLGSDFNEPFLNSLAAAMELRRNFHTATPAHVTVQRRVLGDTEYLFVMNAGDKTAHIAAPDKPTVELLSGKAVTHGITLPPYGVAVLRVA